MSAKGDQVSKVWSLCYLFHWRYVLLFTVPIAISLALSSLCVISRSAIRAGMMNMLAQSMVTSVDNYSLMAIPFFMLLGIIMEKTGIAQWPHQAGRARCGLQARRYGYGSHCCLLFLRCNLRFGSCLCGCNRQHYHSCHAPLRNYDPAYCGALLASWFHHWPGNPALLSP